MAARLGRRPDGVVATLGLLVAATLADAGTARARTVTAEERAAWDRARPVFEEHCFSCHTTRGEQRKRKALRHLNMDRYPFGGHHTEDLTRAIREVLGATGDEPTMPTDDPGAVKGEELALVLAWADAVDRATGGTKGRPRGHHHEHGAEGSATAGRPPAAPPPRVSVAVPGVLRALLAPARSRAGVAIVLGVRRVGGWLLGVRASPDAPPPRVR